MEIVRVYCFHCDQHYEVKYDEYSALRCPECGSIDVMLLDILDS